MLNLTNSDIIAVASGLIALLALFATFWQARISRIHNKLSVRPYMEHAQDRLFGEQISVSIGNHGLGPSIIDDLEILYLPDSKKMKVIDFLTWLFDRTQLKDINYKGTNFTNETVFSSNKTVIIFNIPLQKSQEFEFMYIQEILNNSVITIKYRSFYGDKYVYTSPLTVA